MVSSTVRQLVASMEARCYAILRYAARTNNLYSEETKDLNLSGLVLLHIGAHVLRLINLYPAARHSSFSQFDLVRTITTNNLGFKDQKVMTLLMHNSGVTFAQSPPGHLSRPQHGIETPWNLRETLSSLPP